jgi:uncharacterized membrane protein
LKLTEEIVLKPTKTLNNLIKEAKTLLLVFVAVVILFQIIFYKESFITNLKTVLSLYWLFVLPGFYSLYHWHNKLDFIERFVIGVVLGFALVGILAYYLNIYTVHVKYYGVIIPLLILVINRIIILIISKRKSNIKHSKPDNLNNELEGGIKTERPPVQLEQERNSSNNKD